MRSLEGTNLPVRFAAIEVPLDFEPPQHDIDDSTYLFICERDLAEAYGIDLAATLPSKSHPSYPFGRPQHLSHPATTSSTRVSLSRMRGRNGVGVKDLLGRLGMGKPPNRIDISLSISLPADVPP